MKIRHPEKENKPINPIKKKPDWIRSKLSNSKEFFLTEVSNEVMKVIELAHLDKFFKIKSTTSQNASQEVSSQPSEANSEPEIEASENIDLNPSDNTEQKSEEPSTNQTEEKEPSIKRDDDEGDKIKFKR